MSKHIEQGQKPWWEKLTEASADTSKGKSLIVKVLVVAILVMGGLLIWNLVQDSSSSDQEKLSEVLFRAGTFLPDNERINFGGMADLEKYNETMASAFFRHHEANTLGRDNPLSAIADKEAAKKYLVDVLGAIEELKDNRDLFKEEAWDIKYLHTLQQLHFYASLNCVESDARMKQLDLQLEVLKELESKYAGKGIPSLIPYADTDKTVLQLWKDTAEADKKSLQELKLTGPVEVKSDSNLVVTIELDNGSLLKMHTFSEVSTKAVQNFLTLVRSGLYDGIAVHRLDVGAGLVELGSPWSREAPERKFLWGREQPGYTLPLEGTSLLPVKRGSVSIKLNGQAGHGIFFEIHVAEPDRVRPGHTVIGEIYEGLEALEPWMQTEVHDEAGVADRLLPRTRLGIKKISVEGEVDFKGEDSWAPKLKDMPVPAEANALEKQFEEALKATAPVDEEANEEAKPEDGDEDK